jgi:hypothetical protein
MTDAQSGSDYLYWSAVAADQPAWLELAGYSADLYAWEPD